MIAALGGSRECTVRQERLDRKDIPVLLASVTNPAFKSVSQDACFASRTRNVEGEIWGVEPEKIE
jgi:hypothetical protein